LSTGLNWKSWRWMRKFAIVAPAGAVNVIVAARPGAYCFSALL
jgi:hypothetical protein